MGSNTEKPRILIAEDHPMISIMLSDMIGQLISNSDVTVVSSVEKATGLGIQPDVVIADLDLPDSKGLATIEAFARLFPDCPRLICSGVLDAELALEAGKAGFLFVNKASSYHDLLESIQTVLIAAGVVEPRPQTAEKTVNEFHSNICAPGSGKPLTWKQVEIMRKTAEGLSAKEVAREMEISPDTVRGHIKEIFLRLGAKNKGQAVEIFMRAERKARLLDS